MNLNPKYEGSVGRLLAPVDVRGHREERGAPLPGLPSRPGAPRAGLHRDDQDPALEIRPLGQRLHRRQVKERDIDFHG